MKTPTHLVDCTIPIEFNVDEYQFAGRLRCKCGTEIFELFFPGIVREFQGTFHPCTINVLGNFFFIIKSRCVNCASVYLLIDKDLHGWNGVVCHNPVQAALPRPELFLWKCSKCEGFEHKAIIKIGSEGEADFKENVTLQTRLGQWFNAFSYINIDIECQKCGTITMHWVNYETM